MDEHRFTPPSGRRSPERDAQVRTLTRITRGVAAAAVLGTVVFGGLAAASTSSTAATPTAAATADVAGATAVAPTASAQPPVASSGGS